MRAVGAAEQGGLRIDGGPSGFRERTVSLLDVAWAVVAADDVAAHGGVLDEARVNLDGTPKGATRWIDTGWARGDTTDLARARTAGHGIVIVAARVRHQRVRKAWKRVCKARGKWCRVLVQSNRTTSVFMTNSESSTRALRISGLLDGGSFRIEDLIAPIVSSEALQPTVTAVIASRGKSNRQRSHTEGPSGFLSAHFLSDSNSRHSFSYSQHVLFVKYMSVALFISSKEGRTCK